MYKLILLTWLCLLPIQMVSSSDSTKKLFPKTDVNDLVYFNQVFDMATKQTSDQTQIHMLKILTKLLH